MMVRVQDFTADGLGIGLSGSEGRAVMVDERLRELLDFLSDTLEPARQAEIQGLYVRALSGEPAPRSSRWVAISG
jgi:hypothetical protein